MNENDMNNNETLKNIDTPIDVTDTYMGIYKEHKTDEQGRMSTAIKVGLFKKGKVYDIPGKNRPVQAYTDVLSNNSAGLLLYEDGQDIVATDNLLGNVDLLSSDYNVGPYSSLTQEIEQQNGIKPFNSDFVGLGLVGFEQANPDTQGNVPLSVVLEKLKSFSELSISLDKRLDESNTKESIAKSLEDAKNHIENVPMNNIKFYDVEIDNNTNKHR